MVVLNVVGLRKRLKIGIAAFLVLLDVAADALYENPTRPLGLLTWLEAVSSGKKLFNSQHGAEVVKGLDEELLSVTGEHVR